jgi:hypothetical protein
VQSSLYVSSSIGGGVDAPPRPVAPKPVAPAPTPVVPPPSEYGYYKYIYGLQRAAGALTANFLIGLVFAYDVYTVDQKDPYKNGVKKKVSKAEMEECKGYKPDGTEKTSGPVCHFLRPGWTADQVKSAMNYVHFANVGFYRGPDGKIVKSGGNFQFLTNYAYNPGRVATTKITETFNGQTKTIRLWSKSAADAERGRADAQGTPFKGIVGHLPDRVWMGRYPGACITPCSSEPTPLINPGNSFGWLDQDGTVNSCFGNDARVSNYPEGYVPTEFRVYLMTKSVAISKTQVEMDPDSCGPLT